MKESKWFKKKLRYIKEISIPHKIAEPLNLKRNDKIAVKIKIANDVVIFPTRVGVKTTDEYKRYRFCVPKSYQRNTNKKTIYIKLKKLNPIFTVGEENNEILDLSGFRDELQNLSIKEWVDKNSIVIWHGMKHPIIIPRKIEIMKFAKYLGLYFTDGSKTSHYCSCASTREMTKLVLRYYHKIIRNPKFSIFIYYRKSKHDKRSDTEIKKALEKYWNPTIAPYKIKNITIRNRRKSPRIDNPFGSLRLDDSRALALYIHKWLVKKVIEYGEKNKDILINFFKGGALGDACASLRRNDVFQHLEISTNKNECKIWKRVCKNLDLSYYEQPGTGEGVVLQITDYYKTVLLLQSGLFKEHQKREKKLITGLRNRVETYILQSLLLNNNSQPIKGEFGKITPSFFYVNKGGDLVKNNLVKIKNDVVSLTSGGKKFSEILIKFRLLNKIK